MEESLANYTWSLYGPDSIDNYSTLGLAILREKKSGRKFLDNSKDLDEAITT